MPVLLILFSFVFAFGDVSPVSAANPPVIEGVASNFGGSASLTVSITPHAVGDYAYVLVFSVSALTTGTPICASFTAPTDTAGDTFTAAINSCTAVLVNAGNPTYREVVSYAAYTATFSSTSAQTISITSPYGASVYETYASVYDVLGGSLILQAQANVAGTISPYCTSTPCTYGVTLNSASPNFVAGMSWQYSGVGTPTGCEPGLSFINMGGGSAGVCYGVSPPTGAVYWARGSDSTANPYFIFAVSWSSAPSPTSCPAGMSLSVGACASVIGGSGGLSYSHSTLPLNLTTGVLYFYVGTSSTSALLVSNFTAYIQSSKYVATVQLGIFAVSGTSISSINVATILPGSAIQKTLTAGSGAQKISYNPNVSIPPNSVFAIGIESNYRDVNITQSSTSNQMYSSTVAFPPASVGANSPASPPAEFWAIVTAPAITQTITSTVTSTTVSTVNGNTSPVVQNLDNFILALVVILAPALLLAGATKSIIGAIFGGILGIAIASLPQVNLLPSWMLIAVVIGILGMLFLGRNHGGGGI